MKQRSHCLGIGPVFAALMLTGCGDPASVATVSGMVTHGGKSVAGVNVQFVPQDKKSPLASGPVDETGRYTLGRAMGRQGCAAGTYSVRLVEQDPGALPFRIPADMSTKSTLTFDVKPGANTFDIQIPVAAKPARK